ARTRPVRTDGGSYTIRRVHTTAEAGTSIDSRRQGATLDRCDAALPYAARHDARRALAPRRSLARRDDLGDVRADRRAHARRRRARGRAADDAPEPRRRGGATRRRP